MKQRQNITKTHSELDDSRLFIGLEEKPIRLLPGLAVRIVIFAFIWWGLSAGILDQIILVFILVLASALLSILLVPPQKISTHGLLKFIPFFIRLSVMGGIDVASRAFKPSMPLKTGFIKYHLKLIHPTARILFVWIVSLLPGTASVSLENQTLHIHVLDQKLDHDFRLKELEKHITMLFKKAEN